MEKKYKHLVKWDIAGINKPPSKKEIRQTLATIKENAQSHNIFILSVTEGVYRYLLENLGDAYIKLIKREPLFVNCCDVAIGADKDTVEDYIKRTETFDD